MKLSKYMLLICCGLCLAVTGLTGTAAAEEMEAINIELPEPFFGGTPLDYWGPNLEPYDFKERPPFMAPKGTELISKGKPVTSSDKAPLVGEVSMLTDGDKDYAKKSLIELNEGVQWMQIDLEKEAMIYAVVLWHFHEGKRVYFDIVVQASNDADFKDDVTTLYNNDMDNTAGLGAGKDKEYIESEKGRLIDGKGTKARYVRFYGNGNTANDLSNYVEAEVFGKFE